MSKKQLAAKERKRAKKAPKNIYDSEKMTLADAVQVLRVRRVCVSHCACFDVDRQAVEVASPNATYELVVKTEMGKGSTIPKGRFDLPRQTKEQSKDRILVFAEGRQAEEAKAKEVERVKAEVKDAVGKRKAAEPVPVDEVVISKKARVDEEEDEQGEEDDDDD